MLLSSKLPAGIYEQVIKTGTVETEVSGRTGIAVRCGCGKTVKMSARNLVRRWGHESHWRCKSCDVRTYANNPAKIQKFKTSFAKTAKDPEHRRKCSLNGKKAWQDPETRERITEAVRRDNLTNPKKAEARKKALEALRSKSWFREHMARIRSQQRNSGTSILETAMANILDSLGIDYKQHFMLGPWTYDFAAGLDLIEIQGEYWHRNTQANDSAKATYGATLGYRVHHVWEHEFAALGKVREMVQRWFGKIDDDLIEFKFKDVMVGEAGTLSVRAFLGAYHYLPALSKSGYHIGAYLGKELIATATFSSPVRRETAAKLGGTVRTIRELSRFCIHPSRHKKNFASWFLSRAIKIFKEGHAEVTMLVAFADETAGHTGCLYSASGWSHCGTTQPDYVYLTNDGYYAHKKTIWDRASKSKMTELEYATANGLIRIDTKQKHKYTLPLE